MLKFNTFAKIPESPLTNNIQIYVFKVKYILFKKNMSQNICEGKWINEREDIFMY